MNNRILFISYYYYPDIGPGALRAKSIVDSLIKYGPSDLKIEVLTTMPNRYPSLDISAAQIEFNDNVIIHRFQLPKHQNGIFDQIIAFATFFFYVQKFVYKKKWNIVVATSGRLFTASLAKLVSMQVSAKLYLDIRDLFTDTINHITQNFFFKIFMPLFYLIEKWTFNSANKINIVSSAFLPYVKKIAPNVPISAYTNGVDNFFLKKNFINNIANKKPVVLYVGNIGDGQSLNKIIPLAANNFKDINFKIIGDGSGRKLLTNDNLIISQNNIKISKPVLRHKLFKEYKKADILFIHLNDADSFKKVLPSKIFEYAATGKPILAGVRGYPANFLKNNVKGVEIFDPSDVTQMKVGLRKLLNGPKIFERKNFCLKFDRDKIIKELTIDVLSLLKETLIKSRLLVVHRYYWPDKTSCSNILHNIVRHLSKNFNVDVLSSKPSYYSKTFYPKKKIPSVEIVNNTMITRLSLPNETNNRFLRIQNAIILSIYILFKSIFKKYDVIISTTTPPILNGFFSALASKLSNTKFIYFCMDISPEIGKQVTKDFENVLFYKFLLKLDNWACQTASLVLVHSKDMFLSLQKRFVKKKYNLKIMRHFSPAINKGYENKKNIMPFKLRSKLKLIYAGNIGRFQGLETIIKSMCLIRHRKDIELLIVGEGIEKSFLKEKLKKLKVNIKILDYRSSDSVKKIIKKSDIGIMTIVPNVYKFSCPSKIPTYLEQGKPIIAMVERNSQIAKEIIHDKYGFVVNSNNQNSLAKTLIRLADNKNILKRRNLNVKKVYKKYYSSQPILGEWVKLVEEVVAGK
jgi:glycosyltransferase involved in cell wall biosynthesis